MPRSLSRGDSLRCTDRATGRRDVDGLHPQRAKVRLSPVRRLLEDPDLRDRLGRSGRETAAQYAWERRIDQLESFLEGRRRSAFGGVGGVALALQIALRLHRLRRLFLSLPRRAYLTLRYHGVRELAFRLVTFPARLTSLGPRMGLVSLSDPTAPRDAGTASTSAA